MTVIKVLSIYDFGNYGVKRETEKAYLLAKNTTGNKDTWFPKSAFQPVRNPLNGKVDQENYVEVKDWFFKKMSPDQEAILGQVNPVYL